MENQSIKNIEPKSHYLQIDILKGFMIMLVIIDHAIPWGVRAEWGHSLWERISIPVFLIIMGLNAANSFKNKGLPTDSGSQFIKYLLGKVKRYLIPFGLLYVISTIVGLMYYGNFESLLVGQFDDHWGRIMLYDFILPFYGPGNWFIPILMQSVIIVPLMYAVYHKFPKMTLFVSFLWEIFIQIFVFIYIGHPSTWISWDQVYARSLIQCSVFFYLNAITIGFWFADHKELSIGTKKLPFHFFIVLFLLIVGYLTFVKPFLTPILQNAMVQSDVEVFIMIFLLFLILTLVGIYVYRPLKFYPIIWLSSVILGIGFLFSLDIYDNYTYFIGSPNPALVELEPRIDLFLVSSGIFIIPVLINLLIKPKNKNWWVWLMLLPSAIYIAAYQWTTFRFYVIAGDYHFLVYPWSAFIILMFIKMIPQTSKNKFLRGFALVGKSSFHILLSQMFVYGIWLALFGDFYLQSYALYTHLWGLFSGLNYTLAVWLYVILMWAICIPLGIGWYLLEKNIFAFIKQKRADKSHKGAEEEELPQKHQ